MSEGRVWHVGCEGELVWIFPGPFRCTHCDLVWDGKKNGVAEYRS